MSTVKRVKTSEIELKDRLVSIRRVTKVTKEEEHLGFLLLLL